MLRALKTLFSRRKYLSFAIKERTAVFAHVRSALSEPRVSSWVF